MHRSIGHARIISTVKPENHNIIGLSMHKQLNVDSENFTS